MCLFLHADEPVPAPDPGREPDPEIDLIIQLLEDLEDHLAPPVVPGSFAPLPGG